VRGAAAPAGAAVARPEAASGGCAP
jgi:hypothetical protein